MAAKEKARAETAVKRQAAQTFVSLLRQGPLGNKVARVILFGSVSRNEVHENSDVDVLVFAAADAAARTRFTADAAWQATMQHGEQIAHITYGLTQLFQPRSYLLIDALKNGEELFAVTDADARQMEALGLQEKANRHLAQSQRAFDQGDFELAIVGAYTAAELAVKALVLLKPDVDLPLSHGGTLQMFGREYVKTGRVPADWGRRLYEALETRSRALYETHVIIRKEETADIINLAQSLLNFLQQLLET